MSRSSKERKEKIRQRRHRRAMQELRDLVGSGGLRPPDRPVVPNMYGNTRPVYLSNYAAQAARSEHLFRSLAQAASLLGISTEEAQRQFSSVQNVNFAEVEERVTAFIAATRRNREETHIRTFNRPVPTDDEWTMYFPINNHSFDDNPPPSSIFMSQVTYTLPDREIAIAIPEDLDISDIPYEFRMPLVVIVSLHSELTKLCMSKEIWFYYEDYKDLLQKAREQNKDIDDLMCNLVVTNDVMKSVHKSFELLSRNYHIDRTVKASMYLNRMNIVSNGSYKQTLYSSEQFDIERSTRTVWNKLTEMFLNGLEIIREKEEHIAEDEE